MINTAYGGNNFANISSFVSTNARLLQNSLVNIAAGQRVMKPQHGIGDYFVGKSYYSQVKGLESAKRELFQAKTILELAGESINLVFGDLTNMMESVKDYFNTDDPTIKAIHREKINEYKMLINQTMDNTVFGGEWKKTEEIDGAGNVKEKMVFEPIKLLKNSSAKPIFEVTLDPDKIPSEKMVISFGKDSEVDVSGIDLDLFTNKDDAVAAVQAQLERAARYMGALNGMKIGIDAQININENTSNNMLSATNNVLGADDMDNIFSLTKQQIQQQAAVSMLSQGNMMRGSVLNLVKFA